MVEVNPTAVQATNDSSCVSKLSAARSGYFKDEFLTYFIARQQRRAPLINWGYYVRSRATGHVTNAFLDSHTNQKTQIISFGAGFDTTFFRFAEEGKLGSTHYIEVDFPAVISRKEAIIRSTTRLTNLSSDAHYKMIGCDITSLDKLSAELTKIGVDRTLPTLLLAEVVLTYIKPDHVNALLSWAASSFDNACFCAYEQICPHDGFGGVMLRHFHTISSPLLNIHRYPLLSDQRKRYQDAGWSMVDACDMNQFLSILPKEEIQRLLSLEMFDEFEELHLKCAHYMLLCAFNGTCCPLSSSLSLPPSPTPVSCLEAGMKLELEACRSTSDQWKVNRFSHCSVMLSSSLILMYGGFGHQDSNGAHSRLDSLVCVRQAEEDNVFESVDMIVEGETLPGLLHHTMTLLSDSSVLLVGGRGSPRRPNPYQYILKPVMDEKWVCSKIGTNEVLARWRHSATLLKNGLLVIVGGCGEGGVVLDDMQLLDYTKPAVSKIPLSLPIGRHSHTAVRHDNDVIIVGGLDSFLHPVSTGLRLSSSDDNTWILTELIFTPPLPSGYSMSGHCIDDHTLVLLGGVSQLPLVTLVDLRNLTTCSHKLTFPPSLPIPLLHNFTAHWLEENRKMVVLGGGGNCFSFGTHFNTTPLTLTLP